MAKNYDILASNDLRYEMSEFEDLVATLLKNYQSTKAELLAAEDRILELEDEVEKLNERVYELNEELQSVKD